jgi:hypothetical protein
MGSGMNTPELIFELKILQFFDAGTGSRDLVNPGSGIRDGKYRIRDKHPDPQRKRQTFNDVFQG